MHIGQILWNELLSLQGSRHALLVMSVELSYSEICWLAANSELSHLLRRPSFTSNSATMTQHPRPARTLGPVYDWEKGEQVFKTASDMIKDAHTSDPWKSDLWHHRNTGILTCTEELLTKFNDCTRLYSATVCHDHIRIMMTCNGSAGSVGRKNSQRISNRRLSIFCLLSFVFLQSKALRGTATPPRLILEPKT